MLQITDLELDIDVPEQHRKGKIVSMPGKVKRRHILPKQYSIPVVQMGLCLLCVRAMLAIHREVNSQRLEFSLVWFIDKRDYGKD